MNLCVKDLIENKQCLHKNIIYNCNNMTAAMSVGYSKNKQEDAVLISEHKELLNTNIIAVADGMGGINNGERASNIVLLELAKWFQLNQNFESQYIQSQIKKLFDKVDDMVRRNCDGGGTTVSAAIITDKGALLLNVGDSRIYVENNDLLFQITNDHTLSWDLYKLGILVDKDSIRYHKKNNLINSRIGCDSRKLKIDFIFLPYSEYDKIFIFTDGITDCISDAELNYILKNYNYRYNLAKNFVISSLINNSSRNDLNNKYYDIIFGGKDNSSAVTYVKKR